jgi:hypothetical protein
LPLVFVPLAACGSRNELTADRPPIAEHSFATGSRPPPAEVLGGVLPVSEGIALLGSWEEHAVPAKPMGCESPAATRVSEQLKPVGCEWDACTPLYAWATLRLEVAEYLLAARETRVADLESCIAEGRCPREDFHPEPLHYEDTLGLPPAEARAFCRAYGGDLPTEAQLARALVTDDRFLPDDVVDAIAAERPDCNERNWQATGTTSPFGHAELVGRQRELVRSSGYYTFSTGNRAPCAPIATADPTRLSAEARYTSATLPVCELEFSGVRPPIATRAARGDAGASAFRCAFPTQVIP